MTTPHRPQSYNLRKVLPAQVERDRLYRAIKEQDPILFNKFSNTKVFHKKGMLHRIGNTMSQQEIRDMVEDLFLSDIKRESV